MKQHTKGTELHPKDREYVLSAYINRYTKDHIPQWVRNSDFKYPVQFSNDLDWLENTFFRTRKDGRLDQRVISCIAIPTWPDGKPKTLTAESKP